MPSSGLSENLAPNHRPKPTLEILHHLHRDKSLDNPIPPYFQVPTKAMQYFQRERPTTFLDLPVEIRIDIYDLLLVQRRAVSFHGRLLNDTVKFNVYPHVLRVCRQIHEEAASVFYGRNEMRLLLYGIHGVPYQR